MSETFFIGDTHFGHKNILSYEPVARPFISLDDMHDALIARWNNVVGKFDKVYMLGDFCFGRKNIAFADHLNGQKRLIMGNHDVYGAEEYLKFFLSVHGALYWNKCLMTHIPSHPRIFDGKVKLNIHGHLHSKLIEDHRYINVSCEQNGLIPIHADKILEQLYDD